MTWNETRVLVVGDVMLDRWIYMRKTKLSPEAPVPIVVQQEYFAEIGGAGNAFRHLRNLSRAEHSLIGVRGQDPSGVEVASLGSSNVEDINIIIDSGRKTTVKERFFIDGEPIFRRDNEDVMPLSQEIENKVVFEISNRLEHFKVLLLSDYAKGMLTKSLITNLLHLAKTKNVPIVTDPGLGRLALFAGCDIIKPNAKEWRDFVLSHRNRSEALNWLFSRGTKFVIVTTGKHGVTLFSNSKTLSVPPIKEISAVDVTGAGDSVAAAISLIIGSGERLIENLGILNSVGGLTVGQNRTVLPKL